MTTEERLQVLQKHLDKIDDVIAKGTYKDDWDSLRNHPVPEWYQKAKFGIFIHWGVFSVPAWGNEWYPCHMYEKGKTGQPFKKNENGQVVGKDYFTHHNETYGDITKNGYKIFVPQFKCENFDPKQWADLFKEAGANFVMPVAEHCDGFQMYDSELSDWCATKMGPHKDMCGLLKEQVEANGMTFCTSSHRVEHYWFMSAGRNNPSDFPEEIEYADMYWPSALMKKRDNGDIYVEVDELYMKDWLARTCEIVDKYQPKIMYFDWWIQVKPMKPYLKKFAAYYYNRAKEWGKEVTINYKNDAFLQTVGVKDIERGQLSDVSPYFWQNDTSVAKNSWCYSVGNDYKKPYEILGDLVDVVSKNGSLLLNFGPKADGTIPEEDASILKAIGQWMKVNGEAIYSTIPWRKYGEGPTLQAEGHFSDMNRREYTSEDFRFTLKGNVLYVFAMKWPEDGVVRIKTLGIKSKIFNSVVENVEILGHDSCTYKLCDQYMTVVADGIKTDCPVCIKVTID